MRYIIKDESTSEEPELKVSKRLRFLLTRHHTLSKKSAIEMKALIRKELGYISLSKFAIFDKKENCTSYAIDKYYASINGEV